MILSAIVLIILDTKKTLKAADIFIRSTGVDVIPTYDVIVASHTPIGWSNHYAAVAMFINKTLSRWSRRDTEAITLMLAYVSHDVCMDHFAYREKGFLITRHILAAL